MRAERDKAQEREMTGGDLTLITSEEFLEKLDSRRPGERLSMQRLSVKDVDLTGRDLSNVDFACTRFENCILDGANMDSTDLRRCFFVNCSMKGIKLTNANANDTSFRRNDLSGSDFSGTDFYYAGFDYANLEGVTTDENTRFFGDAIPQEGAFIAWKLGPPGARVIQLLVPADARRTCSTCEIGRCDKAKVLSITDIDNTQNYEWATAMVDDDFLYETGKMVYPANGFGDIDWLLDAPGIHFFMDREMAVKFFCGTGY